MGKPLPALLNRSNVQVGALSDNAALGVGIGLALAGGVAATLLWKSGQIPAAIILGVATIGGAPKAAAALTKDT